MNTLWTPVYRSLLLLARPWVQARLRWRARREPEYGERISERFGHVPPGIPRGCVWFHTVSAGETIAAAPLIAALARAFAPQPFLVTTMTPTGSAQVRARLGDCVYHCYAPYDFRDAVRRFFDRVQPRMLVLMETELWPNLVEQAHRRGVATLLVNARLSERSARGYGRVGGLTRSMLQRLDRIACQYPDHAERFLALGAPAARVMTLGSVKFDLALPDDHAVRLDELRERWRLGPEPVWIAASTHAGEEAVVLDAHRRLRERQPHARLLLVPRHPARAGEVLALCREAGFAVARHSEAAASDGDADVILGDTMGQLLYLYGLADAAFVGGSLVAVGGHNPIEPALCGVPLLMGPEDFNFPDVVERFRAAGCLEVVRDAAEMADRLRVWLDDPALRQRLGAKARAVVAANTGATARLDELLRAEIRAAVAQ